MREAAEVRWPGIQKKMDVYYSLPEGEEGWSWKRQMRIEHPDIASYLAQKDTLYADAFDQLNRQREVIGYGTGKIATVDYRIGPDGPNMHQQAILDTIEEQNLTVESAAAWVPEKRPADWTEQDIERSRRTDAVYRAVVAEHGNTVFALERTFFNIGNTIGWDSAKIWAKQNGYFDISSDIKMGKAMDPVLVGYLDDKDLKNVSWDIVWEHIDQQWPDYRYHKDYYDSIDKRHGGWKTRRAYRDDHPVLKEVSSYLNGDPWKVIYNDLDQRRKAAQAEGYYDDRDASVTAKQGETPEGWGWQPPAPGQNSEGSVESKSTPGNQLPLPPGGVPQEVRPDDVGSEETVGVTFEAEKDFPKLVDALVGVESGDSYTAEAKKGSASGRYQYIDSTWNGYGGYTRAKDAPPEIQDQKFAEDIAARVARFGEDDLERIIAYHYHPPTAVQDKSQWDVVPAPEYGNTKTVREYVDIILDKMGK
jgi:hypothetical protein